MHILSQYKDYYDYLTGIYGVDEKIILDRRSFDKFTPYISMYSFGTKVQVFVCDKGYDGYYTNDKYYWGENLLSLLTPEQLEKHNNQKPKYKDSISLQTETNKRWGNHVSFSLIPYDLQVKHNTNQKCPILIPNSTHNTFTRFPVLKDLGISSILPPKDIFLMLSEWLAPKENHIDTRTDKEKIIGAGFDTKTSFRKM